MSTTLHWNTVLMELSRRDHSKGYAGGTQSGPTRTSLAMAITHIAIYNAVMAKVDPRRHYAGVTGGIAKIAVAPELSLNALIDGAAATVLSHLYRRQIPLIREATVTPGADEGFATGAAIANAVLHSRRDDEDKLSNGRSETTESSVYGLHKVDPFDPAQAALSKQHGTLNRFCSATPTAMDAYPGHDASRSGGFPENLLANDHFRTDYEEVYRRGAALSTARTAEEKMIGTYWGYDGAQGLGVPPRLYNQIARKVLEARYSAPTGLKPDQLALAVEDHHATFFAKVHCAMADAGIDAWYYKYKFNLWRPVVGIRNESHTQGDARPDRFWTPLGAPQTNQPGTGPRTPPFPAYPSGHATFGAAVFQVLALHFGDGEIAMGEVLDSANRETQKGAQPFEFVSDELDGVAIDADGSVRTKVNLRYGSYAAAVRENAESRVYLGVHWRFDGLPPKESTEAQLKIGGVHLGLEIGKNAQRFFHGLQTPAGTSGDSSA